MRQYSVGVSADPTARMVAGAFLELAPQLIRLLSSTLDLQPGLTLRQFRVLQQLGGGPQRARDLANSTGVTAPTMSAALANLESLGLIERTRDPEDGRAALVAITPTGSAALEYTSDVLMGALQKAAAGIDEEDAAAAARICAVMQAGATQLLSRQQAAVWTPPQPYDTTTASTLASATESSTDSA